MTVAVRSTVSSAKSSSSSTPTLRLGSRGSSVVQLQSKLRSLGYNIGAADGIFGPKTLAAVKSFQKRSGLTSDGIVGPRTWAKLNASKPAPSPVLRSGMKGTPVTALQQRLAKLGYNPGPADGQFGPRTLSAVKSFQRNHGLVADGIVGPKTWAKLGINPQGPVTQTGSSNSAGTVTGYVNGVARRITLGHIPNGKTMRSDAAAAYNRMYAAARSAGITLTPVSGFRTMAEQRSLYQLYLSGKGNLAARPGYSNHQGGIAVDISVGSTKTATYRWLANNAARFGFRRTVPSEPWHWEFRG